MKANQVKPREKNTQATTLVNPWITESTYSLDFQSSSTMSLMKNSRKQQKNGLPSSTVGIIIGDTSSEKQPKEPLVNERKNRRQCPLLLTILLGILSAVSLIALIVTVCVLLLVSKTSTTTTTSAVSLATTTVTTTVTTSTLSSNITVGIPPLFRWNSTGTTIAGVVGTPGTAANRLNVAFGLTLDSSNTLYIVDSNNNRIQRWFNGSTNGTTVAGQANGIPGTNLSYLQNPSSIVVSANGSIYVTDTYNHRVQLWHNGTSSGITIAGTGIAGSSNNRLNFPYGIALDVNSNTLYIADQANHRIMRYLPGATAGSIVAGGNGAGTDINQLSSPCGIYFDSLTNSLIIANFAANNIVRWPIGASSWLLIAGDMNGISGNTATLLNRPLGVVLDPWGNVYVSDTYNQRIQFFLTGQSNGTTIAGVTSTLGSTSNLFRYPYSLALDNQFNLYVCDAYNFRVQRFLRY